MFTFQYTIENSFSDNIKTQVWSRDKVFPRKGDFIELEQAPGIGKTRKLYKTRLCSVEKVVYKRPDWSPLLVCRLVDEED